MVSVLLAPGAIQASYNLLGRELGFGALGLAGFLVLEMVLFVVFDVVSDMVMVYLVVEMVRLTVAVRNP
jgi:hypothetical protein